MSILFIFFFWLPKKAIFFKFYFIFKFYIIVLVLPNIKMNPPQVGFRVGNTCFLKHTVIALCLSIKEITWNYQLRHPETEPVFFLYAF